VHCDIFFNNITTTKNSFGEIKAIFGTLEAADSTIECSSASNGHRSNRRIKRVHQTSVVRDLRHIDLHVEPIRSPIFKQIVVATGSKMNAGKILSGIFPSSVEGTTPVGSLIQLPIIKFDKIPLNKKLK
jgi:hypothetical protein